MAKKRGPGRPRLGRDARTIVVAVKFSAREIKAIEDKVKRENAEIEADPLCTPEDKRPATVSSWIRDHALDPLGLAEHVGGD